VVSNFTGWMPEKYRIASTPATGSPPHTGAGIFTFPRTGIKRLMP
jgi:hypothetical protein